MVKHSDIDHTGITGVGGVQITYARKTSDQASTSTSFADVTGLTFAVSASTIYRFRFVLFVLTNTAGEGFALSVNGPAGTYKLGGFLPATTPSPAGNTVGILTGAVADTTGINVSSGPTSSSIAILEGVVSVGGAGGTLALRFKAETGGANSVTIQTNSYGEIAVIT